MNICVMGHITKDINILNNRKVELPGGTAYYTTAALHSLNSDTALITKLSQRDEYLLHEFTDRGIPIFPRYSKETTIFENIYANDLEVVEQRVLTTADPFTVEDIPEGLSPKYLHIGSLTRNDFSEEIFSTLSKKTIISLDVQGFLRDVSKNRVTLKEWEDKEEILSHVGILKASLDEAKILSGLNDLQAAAEYISNLGPMEIIITMGNQGSIIYHKGLFYVIPAFQSSSIVDPTGCGDTYMAGYLYMRSRINDFYKIGLFASALASLKLSRIGPFWGSINEVLQLIGEDAL